MIFFYNLVENQNYKSGDDRNSKNLPFLSQEICHFTTGNLTVW